MILGADQPTNQPGTASNLSSVPVKVVVVVMDQVETKITNQPARATVRVSRRRQHDSWLACSRLRQVPQAPVSSVRVGEPLRSHPDKCATSLVHNTVNNLYVCLCVYFSRVSPSRGQWRGILMLLLPTLLVGAGLPPYPLLLSEYP